MQLRISITYDDGSTVDASASTVDLVAWERQTAKSLARLLEERFLGAAAVRVSLAEGGERLAFQPLPAGA